MNADDARDADDARRTEIANAGRRLERFLESLPPSDLARQSACEGWTFGQCVAPYGGALAAMVSAANALS